MIRSGQPNSWANLHLFLKEWKRLKYAVGVFGYFPMLWLSNLIQTREMDLFDLQSSIPYSQAKP